MKIRVICVGKIREKYLKDALGEYEKRLSRFCKFEIAELSDIKIPDNASTSQCEAVKTAEGESILKKIRSDEYVISLCVEGKSMSSEDFAAKISDITVGGVSTVDFVIGGSLGLSDSVKKRSDMRLSFSSFTFPHQLMRVILAEQIYRAFKINANEQYHK